MECKVRRCSRGVGSRHVAFLPCSRRLATNDVLFHPPSLAQSIRLSPLQCSRLWLSMYPLAFSPSQYSPPFPLSQFQPPLPPPVLRQYVCGAFIISRLFHPFYLPLSLPATLPYAASFTSAPHLPSLAPTFPSSSLLLSSLAPNHFLPPRAQLSYVLLLPLSDSNPSVNRWRNE